MNDDAPVHLLIFRNAKEAEQDVPLSVLWCYSYLCLFNTLHKDWIDACARFMLSLIPPCVLYRIHCTSFTQKNKLRVDYIGHHKKRGAVLFLAYTVGSISDFCLRNWKMFLKSSGLTARGKLQTGLNWVLYYTNPVSLKHLSCHSRTLYITKKIKINTIKSVNGWMGNHSGRADLKRWGLSLDLKIGAIGGGRCAAVDPWS